MHAQFLHDDFNGTSIDTSLWQTSEPFSGSSITESLGDAIFDNRGRLISLATYPGSITIVGAFTITGADSDEFKLVIRTDGTFVNDSFGESANGFIVRFRSSAFFVSDEVSILEIGGAAFSGWTGALEPNIKYGFKVVDDGNMISVFFDDMTTPKAMVQSSEVFGDKFAFYNREQIGSIMHQTRLDYVTATPIPTPTPTRTPVISVSVSPGQINEGGSATFQISALSNTVRPVTVNYSVRGKAMFGVDYSLRTNLPQSGQVTIAPGADSIAVVLDAVADHLPEKNETVVMKLNLGPGYKLSRPKKAKLAIISVP